MKIFGTVRCFICDNDYIKIFYSFHLFFEIIFIILFIFKTIAVLWYKSRKYGQIGDTLCVICFHSAKNHLVELDADLNGCKEPISFIELLFKIKIKATEPLQFSACIPCFISCIFSGDDERKKILLADHSYKPMTNLQYLEWKYDKGAKNETTKSK